MLATHPPPTTGGRSVRLYYVTQAETAPPLFVVIDQRPRRTSTSATSATCEPVRKHFGFEGVPVRVVYRKKKNKRPNTVRER